MSVESVKKDWPAELGLVFKVPEIKELNACYCTYHSEAIKKQGVLIQTPGVNVLNSWRD